MPSKRTKPLRVPIHINEVSSCTMPETKDCGKPSLVEMVRIDCACTNTVEKNNVRNRRMRNQPKVARCRTLTRDDFIEIIFINFIEISNQQEILTLNNIGKLTVRRLRNSCLDLFSLLKAIICTHLKIQILVTYYSFVISACNS